MWPPVNIAISPYISGYKQTPINPNLQLHQHRPTGRTLAAAEVDGGGGEEILAGGDVGEDKPLQKDDIRSQKDEMYRHGGVFGAYGLALVADELDTRLSKDTGGGFGDSSLPRNENPLGRMNIRGLLQNGHGIGGGHVSLVASYVAVPQKSGGIQPVNGFSILDEMGGRIQVGAVVGAHR